MVSTSMVAEIGSLLGDPARVNIMMALIDARARTARELADAAGVSPQTASSHLSKLVAANMIVAEQAGRHRYHRIVSQDVADLIEQMHVAGTAISTKQARVAVPRDPAMRKLRSCYNHLGGRIAVELGDRLLVGESSLAMASLRPEAPQLLGRIGVDLEKLPRGRPKFRACLDWTERRPHLAGAAGAAILARFLELGWVKRHERGRALTVTPEGERGLARSFNIAAIRQ